MNFLSPEKKQKATQEIINFFENERGEEIGVIAAESILDHFLAEIGPQIYNKGIEDSKALIKTRSQDLEFELESLVKK